MIGINNMMEALTERAIAREEGLKHDDARMRYRLQQNTSDSFDDFAKTIGDYYNYHFTTCMSHGGRLSETEAQGRAKELLEREYRRRNGDIVSVFSDAHDGINGGLRVICDALADGLKAESVERYVRDVFDRYVAPNSWEDKVAIIREFINQSGIVLDSSIRRDQPERYAQSYRELIRAYVDGLRQTSGIFRRL